MPGLTRRWHRFETLRREPYSGTNVLNHYIARLVFRREAREEIVATGYLDCPNCGRRKYERWETVIYNYVFVFFTSRREEVRHRGTPSLIECTGCRGKYDDKAEYLHIT